MKNVRHILSQKGNMIFAVKPNLTVYEAIRVMGEQNIGSVLVMEDDQLVGILTERDYARKVVLKGKFSADMFVHEIMTPHPGLTTVEPETSIEECMEIITAKKVRHLPVMENGKLIGLISIGDVVFMYINHQQDIIEDMTSYLYR
ncbi:MAG: CBS domain-containing protein [Saprospiraceae bacterium]|nr:CBS domain-containing protein [Saprospiraceae bacterium]MCF8248499.1 CBS domain-containing protein [Saprospiraceae bacterium]MCF8280570.1 CBS domain-containing protein [Bacteroidales bacterium]MCF8310233.1 CBS domain-containing protein [Saprospiraceae bacterium]MCF8439328.1 CBS domain-containing protein [Saprospiraceae bacterium]